MDASLLFLSSSEAGLPGKGESVGDSLVLVIRESDPAVQVLKITRECPELPNVSVRGPNEYESKVYYNGITAGGDHPVLVYRSDFLTTPFPKPVGRYQNIPVKSLRGVYDTPLNAVWASVGPQILDMLDACAIDWSSIDPARFFTHAMPGEETKGSLGPAVIWVGVLPGSTSADTAHRVTQEILALLLKHGAKGVVVEWREAVLQRLARPPGPPLMGHVDNSNATHHVRRFLTPLLGVPLAIKTEEGTLSSGTLTLWFHEGRDEHGNLSDRVFGVTNCHVLRTDRQAYERKSDDPMVDVLVCADDRYQRGLNEITQAIASRHRTTLRYTQDIIALQASESPNAETTKSLECVRTQLRNEARNVLDLALFQGEVADLWSNIDDRGIGYVQSAAAVSADVEGGTLYTSDWAAFAATKEKVKDGFEGNVVDLGSQYDLETLTTMFNPLGVLPKFEFPAGGKLRIERCATEEDFANPAGFDSEGRHCIIVGKDGNTTDLTIGQYAGLLSYTNERGIKSVEIGIYDSGPKVFASPGDSGSLVWSIIGGTASIVGQLHSGGNAGGPTNCHITYCTPGWYLLEQIQKRFEHADMHNGLTARPPTSLLQHFHPFELSQYSFGALTVFFPTPNCLS